MRRLSKAQKRKIRRTPAEKRHRKRNSKMRSRRINAGLRRRKQFINPDDVEEL